jgi:hypothetical protein
VTDCISAAFGDIPAEARPPSLSKLIELRETSCEAFLAWKI